MYALHIDPESALLEYLAMYYKLGRAGKALDRFGVIDFATTIAPGVRDVLLTGKVYEAVQRPRRSDKGRHHSAITYDAVVLDAPPTGRICQFLGVNSELAGLAKVGPIKSQADKVMALLRSPRTAVHLVTMLEEMPVQETVDGISELREAGLPVGGVIVNLVRPQDLGPQDLAAVRAGTVDATAIASDLGRAKVDVDSVLVASLIHEAADHAVRRQLEDEQRDIVAHLDASHLRAAPPRRRHRPRLAPRAGRAAQEAGDGMSTPARTAPPTSTSTPCSTTPAPASSCAAARAGSARRPCRRRWRCGRPSADARSWS